MAFTILEARETAPGLCRATVKHDGRLLSVMVKASLAEVSALPSNFIAELDFETVIKFEAALPKDDTLSGLFPSDDPSVILIDGSVMNHVESDSGSVLIDVYLQSGPEFILFDSNDFGGIVPAIGTRLRAWLAGLTVFPVNY
jgi:hypothetical protein